MDRRTYKSKPQHLVTDPRTGEIKQIVHSSDTTFGTANNPSNADVYGITTLWSKLFTLKNVHVSASLYVSSSANVSGSAFISGSAAIAGNVCVSTQDTSAGGSGGTGVVYFGDASVVPNSNPTSGIVEYSENGQLKARGPQGNIYRLGQISQRLSGTFTTTNGAGVVTPLSFSVEANSLWRFEYRGSVKSSGATGVKYAINAPTGSALEAQLHSYLGYGGTPQLTALEFTAINALSSAVHAANAGVLGPDLIVGTVAIGATSGSVILVVANALNGDTTTIQPGAYLIAHRCDGV